MIYLFANDTGVVMPPPPSGDWTGVSGRLNCDASHRHSVDGIVQPSMATESWVSTIGEDLTPPWISQQKLPFRLLADGADVRHPEPSPDPSRLQVRSVLSASRGSRCQKRHPEPTVGGEY